MILQGWEGPVFKLIGHYLLFWFKLCLLGAYLWWFVQGCPLPKFLKPKRGDRWEKRDRWDRW